MQINVNSYLFSWALDELYAYIKSNNLAAESQKHNSKILNEILVKIISLNLEART